MKKFYSKLSQIRFQNADSFKKSVFLINKAVLYDFLTNFSYKFVENKSGYKMNCLNSQKIGLKMRKLKKSEKRF